MEAAVGEAKSWLTGAIKAADQLNIGKGHGRSIIFIICGTINMTDKFKTRRNLLTGLVAMPAAITLAAPAIAADTIKWRMVTSWPKNLPGPGITAQRLADQIGTMSGGRLTIKLYAAGELVPPLEVFSAVTQGIAEIAHTAPLFWGGKIPAAPLFTAGPFGLTPLEHITWINHGGGQELMGSAFTHPLGSNLLWPAIPVFKWVVGIRKQLNSLDDLKGLKIRMPGLGGDVMRRLGAAPVSLAPGEIFPALQSGLIDATEFLGPSSDFAMGFYKVAKNYYSPGFHEPNGTGEALISTKALQSLPEDLRAIVEGSMCCRKCLFTWRI